VCLPCRTQVRLGRHGGPAPPDDKATLSMRHRHGLSRDHGHVVAREGVGFFLAPLRREGFPTRLNGALLPADAVPVLLVDGDVLSFGGGARPPSLRVDLVAVSLRAWGERPAAGRAAGMGRAATSSAGAALTALAAASPPDSPPDSPQQQQQPPPPHKPSPSMIRSPAPRDARRIISKGPQPSKTRSRSASPAASPMPMPMQRPSSSSSPMSSPVLTIFSRGGSPKSSPKMPSRSPKMPSRSPKIDPRSTSAAMGAYSPLGSDSGAPDTPLSLRGRRPENPHWLRRLRGGGGDVAGGTTVTVAVALDDSDDSDSDAHRHESSAAHAQPPRPLHLSAPRGAAPGFSLRSHEFSPPVVEISLELHDDDRRPALPPPAANLRRSSASLSTAMPPATTTNKTILRTRTTTTATATATGDVAPFAAPNDAAAPPAAALTAARDATRPARSPQVTVWVAATEKPQPPPQASPPFAGFTFADAAFFAGAGAGAGAGAASADISASAATPSAACTPSWSSAGSSSSSSAALSAPLRLASELASELADDAAASVGRLFDRRPLWLRTRAVADTIETSTQDAAGRVTLQQTPHGGVSATFTELTV